MSFAVSRFRGGWTPQFRSFAKLKNFAKSTSLSLQFLPTLRFTLGSAATAVVEFIGQVVKFEAAHGNSVQGSLGTIAQHPYHLTWPSVLTWPSHTTSRPIRPTLPPWQLGPIEFMANLAIFHLPSDTPCLLPTYYYKSFVFLADGLHKTNILLAFK